MKPRIKKRKQGVKFKIKQKTKKENKQTKVTKEKSD